MWIAWTADIETENPCHMESAFQSSLSYVSSIGLAFGKSLSPKTTIILVPEYLRLLQLYIYAYI